MTGEARGAEVDDLFDRAKGGREVVVSGSARRRRKGLRLAAAQHIEGHPKQEVGQNVQMDLGAPLRVLEDAASVLRPPFQLLPAWCPTADRQEMLTKHAIRT